MGCCERPQDFRADGFITCANCGLVKGRYFITRWGHQSQPIFIYSRTERFLRVLEKYKIPSSPQLTRRFMFIEEQWNQRSHLFDRVYFLNMKFVCHRICSEMGIEIPGPPIKDQSRITKQDIIYKALTSRCVAVEF